MLGVAASPEDRRMSWGRRSAVLLVSTLTAATLGVVGSATPATAAPPGNDDIGAASNLTIPVDQMITYWVLSTQGATLAPGESGQSGCTTLANSVWFKYTATGSGTLLVDVQPSDGLVSADTVVNVYTSSSPGTPTLGSLTGVGCDDESAGVAHNANVEIPAVSGQTYFVQLSDKTDPAGEDIRVMLGLVTPPANNDVGNATPLVANTTTTANTEYSTLQAGESAGGCPGVYNSVWYSYTAPTTYTAALTLSGPTATDKRMTVWQTTSPGAPTIASLNSAYCLTNGQAFTATAGTAYLVQVSDYASPGKHGFQGAVQLQVTAGPKPANDDLGAAAAVVAPGSSSADSTYASTEPTEPVSDITSCPTPAQHTLWYKWTAPTSGHVLLETTDDSTVDPQLAVWTGTPPYPGLTRLTCSDNRSGADDSPLVDLAATSGTTYYLQLGTDGDGGQMKLHLVVPTSTTLTVGSSGQTVTLSAHVGGVAGSPTGTVEFFEGATSLGSQPVSGGAAGVELPGVPLGTHGYRAVYTPDTADYVASTSTEQLVTVAAPPQAPKIATVTTLSVPKKAARGSRIHIRVTVATASGTPLGGAVQVSFGPKSFKIKLVDGEGSVTRRVRKKRTITVVATYAATSTTLASSATSKIKVKPPKRPG
jgi:hypothetical protein